MYYDHSIFLQGVREAQPLGMAGGPGGAAPWSSRGVWEAARPLNIGVSKTPPSVSHFSHLGAGLGGRPRGRFRGRPRADLGAGLLAELLADLLADLQAVLRGNTTGECLFITKEVTYVTPPEPTPPSLPFVT